MTWKTELTHIAAKSDMVKNTEKRVVVNISNGGTSIYIVSKVIKRHDSRRKGVFSNKQCPAEAAPCCTCHIVRLATCPYTEGSHRALDNSKSAGTLGRASYQACQPGWHPPSTDVHLHPRTERVHPPGAWVVGNTRCLGREPSARVGT